MLGYCLYSHRVEIIRECVQSPPIGDLGTCDASLSYEEGGDGVVG